jgi:hypothetical protein
MYSSLCVKMPLALAHTLPILHFAIQLYLPFVQFRMDAQLPNYGS